MTSRFRICVFCASSSRVDQRYLDLARQAGTYCANQGWDLVYGGAEGGLMGNVADAAMAGGSHVIGVIPEVLSDLERAHDGLDTLTVSSDLHQRQQEMMRLADGFLILPGGLGTLAEFFEILTWKQIGLHSKPIVMLNAHSYWDNLLQTFEFMENEQFLHQKSSDLFNICVKIEEIAQNFKFS